MQDATFNPDLLIIAREAAGFTQCELAQRTGFGQNSISRWEAGIRVPSPDEVDCLADSLQRVASFFYRSERPLSVDVALMFHRAKAKTRLGVIRTLHAKLNIVRIAIASLLRQFESWEIHINQFPIEDFANATEIAKMVRAQWQVTNGPIRNLSELLEAAGAIIVAFDFGTNDVDAVGMKSWDTVPIFFINSSAPSDRIRFSLAHELGHIVMHDLPSESMEKEANEFAAELLVPTDSARTELGGISSTTVWRLKQRWKVSAQCLIRRAKDAGLIDEGRYASLMAYFSKQRWRKCEPFPIEPEPAKTLQSLFKVCKEELGFSTSELLKLTGASKEELQTIFMQPPCVQTLRVFSSNSKPR